SRIPAPSMRLPQEARSAAGVSVPAIGSTSILDLYHSKLMSANPGISPVALNIAMQRLVPWEFFKSQKFDINRWLGDGVDNDGDGVRDDFKDSIPPNGEAAFRADTSTLNLPN